MSIFRKSPRELTTSVLAGLQIWWRSDGPISPILISSKRRATGAPLAEIDWGTVYAAGPRGYSDYPHFRPDGMATASISVGLDDVSRRC